MGPVQHVVSVVPRHEMRADYAPHWECRCGGFGGLAAADRRRPWPIRRRGRYVDEDDEAVTSSSASAGQRGLLRGASCFFEELDGVPVEEIEGLDDLVAGAPVAVEERDEPLGGHRL